MKTNIEINFNTIISMIATLSAMGSMYISLTIKAAVNEVRAEFKQESGQMRAEFKHETGQMRAEFKQEIGQLRSEVKEDIGYLKGRLDSIDRHRG